MPLLDYLAPTQYERPKGQFSREFASVIGGKVVLHWSVFDRPDGGVATHDVPPERSIVGQPESKLTLDDGWQLVGAEARS